MKKQHLFIALGAFALGMYLAGQTSNTGIYGTPVGGVLANLWTTGNNLTSGSGYTKTGS